MVTPFLQGRRLCCHALNSWGAVIALMLMLSPMAQAQPAGSPIKADAVWGQGPNLMSLATGSPGELGLLEALALDFAKTHNATVRWTKAGSGQAMRLLKERQVDMVLAHAPAAERQAVAEGWATGRRLIGSNEFWLLGPPEDPAQVAQAKDVADAFARIENAGARLVSRGDNSGTHQKELEIWRAAGRIPNKTELIITKDFMTASMRRANDEAAYFLTDSSTYIVERQRVPRLKLLFRGGDLLANPYHTLYLSDPTPGAITARQFGDYLASEPAQRLMRSFGRVEHGEAMYNDAEATARRLGLNR